jgi:hypothetical protein
MACLTCLTLQSRASVSMTYAYFNWPGVKQRNAEGTFLILRPNSSPSEVGLIKVIELGVFEESIRSSTD